MTEHSEDDSKTTLSELIRTVSETQTLAVLVFTMVSAPIAAFMAWDESQIIAAGIALLIVIAAFGWILYRKSSTNIKELPAEVSDSAFVGLDSFEAKDRERFFGRGIETGELLRMVSHRDFRFGVLSGESGSGKTSLLNAGLMPRLAEQGVLAVYLRLLNDPERDIRKAVAKASKIDPKPDEALKEYLSRVTLETASTLVLCCDQFEEFFIHFPTEISREPFMTLVASSVRDADLALKFLFSLREDFLARIFEFKSYIDEPLSTRKVFTLKNFDPAQAADIIERSVRRVELPFQPVLSAQVADDLAINGRVLPTELQIVCLEMQRKRIFTQSQYEKIGAREALVQGYLEEVVCLAGKEQDVKLVLASLISEENTKLALTLAQIADTTRISEASVKNILDNFVLARLIREVQDQQPWCYEFTHEYLIAKIHSISGSVLDEVKKANVSFRHYLQQYTLDNKTRIPLRIALRIRRYSDIRRNAREKEFLAKSIRAGISGIVLIGFLVLVPSGTAVHYIIDRFRIEHNMGVLILKDPGTRELTLVRIFHYQDNQKYPPGPIDLVGDEIDLAGPADYMLTDKSEAPPLKYPVYIEGFDDQVEVTVFSELINIPAGMVFIPPGEFRMGDKISREERRADEKPHDVFLDGFLIDKTEVSNQDYRKFIEAGGYTEKELAGKSFWSDDGWVFISKEKIKEPAYWDDEKWNRNNYPVVGVSWYEAEAYCRFMELRLPTEAEWEKAARGPEGYEYSFGNNLDELYRKANGLGNKDGYQQIAPVIVEKYGANEYGLYHMSGNVWEWVQDWYNADFYDRNDSEKNPVNTARTRFDSKILRGGTWDASLDNLRTSSRVDSLVTLRWNYIGFRCARTL